MVIFLILRHLAVLATLVTFFLGLVAGCGSSGDQQPSYQPPFTIPPPTVTVPHEPIQPIPTGWSFDPRKVALGDKLFHDVHLSHGDTIACASCHGLATGGTDQAFRSIGISGAVGSINTPTVYNTGLNFRQFWDGRAKTLEDQIEGPTQHPKEMGSTWPEIIEKVSADPEYVRAFAEIYPEGVQRETIKDAIATYERSLLTINSRFDQFLLGNQEVLTDQEKRGYALFKSYGCTACHQGANVGGNMFQKFGVTGNYYEDQAIAEASTAGMHTIYDHAGHGHEAKLYKVPSLRVAVLTPPYLHDGSAKTLEDAVRVMAKYQLGRVLAPDEVDAIVAFLCTLPGQYQGQDL